MTLEASSDSRRVVGVITECLWNIYNHWMLGDNEQAGDVMAECCLLACLNY